MSDFYTEQLIKRRTPVSATAIKVLMIVLTFLSAVLIFLLPFAIIAPVLMLVADVLVFRSMDVEYEYMYINGNLDIDKIMSKSRRKRAFEMAINDMEIIAPAGAPELIQYQNIKTMNFTSNTPEGKVYEMVVQNGGVKKRILFEPNEVILDGMRLLAPRKVFR